MPFTISLFPVHSAVKSPMGVLAVIDPNWATYDDYYISLYIEMEEVYRSGTFTDLDLEIQQRPGAEDQVIFNINRLLESQLGFDRPSISGIPTAGIAERTTKRFKVRLEEVKNGSVVSTVTSEITHAYLAGFAHNKVSYMLTHINLKKFLTHQPLTKSVTSYQPEFLYFVAPSTDTYTLKANLVHDDDSTTSAYEPGLSIAAEENDVIIFPVGFQQLGLDSINPGVVSWEVYLNDGFSESRFYELDCHCTPLDRYYLASNSLGGYDTIRTTGELEVNDETEGQNIEKILGPYYEASARMFADVDTSIREKCAQHTGHLTKEENAWLKDLLLSVDVYRIGNYEPNIEAVGDLVPIVIERGSIPRYKDQDFLYGFLFSYKEGFESRGI